MANPVVHFELIGTTPARLWDYYGELFGWSFDDTVSAEVSEPGSYGFVSASSPTPKATSSASPDRGDA